MRRLDPFTEWSLAMHRFLWRGGPVPEPPPDDAPASAHAAQAMAAEAAGGPMTPAVRDPIERLWVDASRARRAAAEAPARTPAPRRATATRRGPAPPRAPPDPARKWWDD